METPNTPFSKKATFLAAIAVISSCVLTPLTAHAQIGHCDPPPPLPDCTGLPLPATVKVEAQVLAAADNAAVGMQGCGRYLISFTRDGVIPTHNRFDVGFQRYDVDTTPFLGLVTLSLDGGFGSGHTHRDPSVAVSPLGSVRVAWETDNDDQQPQVGPLIVQRDFLFGDTPAPVGVPAGPLEIVESDVSVGISDCGAATNGWERFEIHPSGLPLGLFKQATTDPAPVAIRGCSFFMPPDFCRLEWDPAVAMRRDGCYVVCFADAEVPGQALSSFNIALRLYDLNDVLLGAIEGPGDDQWVNQPAVEIALSNQLSPAVDFDDCGNIVVVWAGFAPAGCGAPGLRVFARRFHWAGGLNDPIVAVSSQFSVINTGNPDEFPVTGLTGLHPTVALTREDANAGRFIVAWNAHPADAQTSGPELEVHAQYFEADGTPMGREFRVHDANAPTETSGAKFRWLAASGRHTVQYGPDGQVVVGWSAGDPATDVSNHSVHFTYLPPGNAGGRAGMAPPCLKGDVNFDGLINGLDIQPFINLLLGTAPCADIVSICPADNDCDGDLDIADIPGFVQVLLGGPPCEGFSTAGGNCGQAAAQSGGDCNGNGVFDANDIASGTSADCNGNFVPDECDVDSADPDGNGLVSHDVNANGVPDECEPDCNGNGVPDDKDIADATSADINANGVPDECEPDCNANGVPDAMDIDPTDPDGNGSVSADCNANGRPDECEPDCNNNGVPDDCDIDPTDPDGDGFVSPDCNDNQFPDECDLTLPLFASLDCNANGIPDECDIAAGTSQDCNGNRFPDECDITSGISQDTNGNGVPNECEQQAQGGGSSPAPGGEGAPIGLPPGGNGAAVATPEALTAFTDWCLQQQWGPGADVGCAQQFQRCVDKLAELGLPPANPWR